MVRFRVSNCCEPGVYHTGSLKLQNWNPSPPCVRRLMNVSGIMPIHIFFSRYGLHSFIIFHHLSSSFIIFHHLSQCLILCIWTWSESHRVSPCRPPSFAHVVFAMNRPTGALGHQAACEKMSSHGKVFKRLWIYWEISHSDHRSSRSSHFSWRLGAFSGLSRKKWIEWMAAMSAGAVFNK